MLDHLNLKTPSSRKVHTQSPPANSSPAKIVPVRPVHDNNCSCFGRTNSRERSIWGIREDWMAGSTRFRVTLCFPGTLWNCRDSVSISTLSDCLTDQSGICRKGCHKTWASWNHFDHSSDSFCSLSMHFSGSICHITVVDSIVIQLNDRTFRSERVFNDSCRR